MRHNQALALQHLGPQADAEMFKAHQVDPRDPAIVYALAVLYVQERKWDQALP